MYVRPNKNIPLENLVGTQKIEDVPRLLKYFPLFNTTSLFQQHSFDLKTLMQVISMTNSDELSQLPRVERKYL